MATETTAVATTAEKRTGRPPRISRDEILRVAAEQDLVGLTIAGVAAALGVRPGALYHYFPSKAELVAALATRSAWEAPVPDKADKGWEEWLVEAAVVIRDLFVIYPLDLQVLPAALTGAVPLIEEIHAVLLDAGLIPEQALDAYLLLMNCCLGGAVSLRRLQEQGHLTEADWAATLEIAGIDEASPSRRLLTAYRHYDPESGFRRDVETVILGIKQRLIDPSPG
jgi:AcrR family transcriptional regulator